MINCISRKQMTGFTLIEIMVALVIFAVLAVTLMLRLGENVRNEQTLETKALAATVAENALAQMRIKEEWSAVRDDEDTVNMAGRDWRVKIVVSDTANENLRRVDVHVGPEENGRSHEDTSVILLTSYIGKF